MKAIAKNLKISPKKLRVVAEVIRGKTVEDALNFLKFAPKKGAGMLYKVVFSAMSNAENNSGVDIRDVKVKNLLIQKGIVYKRGQHISRGRMHPILKRTSNVTVEFDNN